MKHVILTNYGRETTNSSWPFVATPYKHRLYFIHDGFCSFKTTDGLFIPQKNKLYLIPAYQKIQPLINDNTNLDHSYVDFILLTELNCTKILDIATLNNEIITSTCCALLKISENYQYVGLPNEHFNIMESYVEILIQLIIAEGIFIPAPPSQITPAIHHIMNNYSENITINELAELCHMSQSYFIALFTQATGCAPHRYIKRHRFSQALNMLRSGLPPHAVAHNIGYSSLASFSNSFKKYYGFSPSKANGTKYN